MNLNKNNTSNFFYFHFITNLNSSKKLVDSAIFGNLRTSILFHSPIKHSVSSFLAFQTLLIKQCLTVKGKRTESTVNHRQLIKTLTSPPLATIVTTEKLFQEYVTELFIAILKPWQTQHSYEQSLHKNIFSFNIANDIT